MSPSSPRCRDRPTCRRMKRCKACAVVLHTPPRRLNSSASNPGGRRPYLIQFPFCPFVRSYIRRTCLIGEQRGYFLEASCKTLFCGWEGPRRHAKHPRFSLAPPFLLPSFPPLPRSLCLLVVPSPPLRCLAWPKNLCAQLMSRLLSNNRLPEYARFIRHQGEPVSLVCIVQKL